MTGAELVARCLEVLRSALDADLPAPTAVAATNWTTDPFALGSYSYIAVGSGPDDMHALSEPVNERLQFAGEATIASHYQTVHGAYLSGLREAQRIDPTATVT